MDIVSFTASLGKINTRDLLAMLDVVKDELFAREGEISDASLNALEAAYDEVKASFDFLDEEYRAAESDEYERSVARDYRNAIGF